MISNSRHSGRLAAPLESFRSHADDQRRAAQESLLTFSKLQARCREPTYNFPSKLSRVDFACGDNEDLQARAVQHARGTRALMHSKVVEIAERFLSMKKLHGSAVEKEVYAQLNLDGLVDRLIRQRPLAFLGDRDSFLLKDGRSGQSGTALFDAIGTSFEKGLSLKDLLSYEEMELSAMMALSTPTFFINDGNRFNRGVAAKKGTFQQEGVYVAQVGSRLERPGRMEFKYMAITQDQNQPEFGYGKDRQHDSKNMLSLWTDFYGVSHFPTFSEAMAEHKENGEKSNYEWIPHRKMYFNKKAFLNRMRIVAETFLVEANTRAFESGQMAYCVVVGLGLGVWSVTGVQQKLLVQAYCDVLSEHEFPNISVLNFSYFRVSDYDKESILDGPNRNISVEFSKRNPAERLDDENLCLIAQYAWDGNSYPGNEYWLGSLDGSGDPAAVCCSTLSELQNPDINPFVSGWNLHVI